MSLILAIATGLVVACITMAIAGYLGRRGLPNGSHVAIGLLAGLATGGIIWYYYTNTQYFVSDHEPQHVRIVNVLSPALYYDAHIPGSINVTMDQLGQKVHEWDAQIPVVFYCSNYWCTSSKEAAALFRRHGFYAYAYEGGMAEWYQLSQTCPEYQVVGPAQEAYLTMEVAPAEHTQQEKEMIISAQELQKLIKNGILPSEG